jgi:hypothetical protein
MKKSSTLLLVPAAAALLLAVAVPVKDAVAQPAATTEPKGLDALSDERLMAELANRGLETLLNRAFEANKVPKAKQDGVRTLIALRELADPKNKLTIPQRQQLVSNIVGGIEQALPSLTDPRSLMQQASLLIRYGVERDVNTLEYWGENPRTQATLRPIAQTVVKILDKAAAEAQKQADDIANRLTGLDDPKVALSEEYSNLATSATYTRAMADYYLALSIDAADPTRKEIAHKAIDELRNYDNAESEVQPVVRNRMAKLHLAAGEFGDARELFKSVAENAGGQVVPAPDVPQQYEARYFSAVADILERKPDDARKSIDALLAWQKQNLPGDKATQEGAGAAAAMLQYRLHSLEADEASGAAEKQEANAKALNVLMALVRTRPELQGIIFEQLMGKLPPNPDLKALDPLLLQALVRKGEDERLKPEGEQIDRPAIERAITAGRELSARAGKGAGSGVDASLAEQASLVVPFLLERLDRRPEAVAAFLDYIKRYPQNQKNARLALDNALALVAQLRREAPDDPQTVKAYESFLPVAIAPPFDRKEFAYEWGRRLQALGRHKEAADVFAQVPADDKRRPNAQFYRMVALQQRLDNEKLDDAAKQRLASEVQQLASEVGKAAQAALAGAQTDQEKQTARSMLVRTTLLSADVARREQKDPTRTLQLLANFEEQAKGLPNENELLSGVLFSRVQAHMALGQNTQATDILVKLLNTKGGGEGAAIVFNLLEKLNADLDRARAAGDVERMRVLAQDRAQLSGPLVDWAKNNPDPNIKKYTYRYSVFDAATKHLAAELEPDPAKRRSALEAALALYEKLQSPENVKLYKETIDEKDRRGGADPNYPDPAVMLGIGLIQYDLGSYPEAQKTLGKLLTDRKLGTPTVTVIENDQPKQVDNDQYWEATLKLLRSNVVVGKGEGEGSKTLTDTQNYLKQLYIRWGATLGGPKWSGEFEKLRKELIPDFQPTDLTAATQPVATDAQP